MEKHVLESIDPKLIGARLQEARRARGITQQAVGEHMEMARTTLVAIEKGERRLTPHELIKLAAFYGRPVSEFVGHPTIAEDFVPQFRAAWRKDFEQDGELAGTAAKLQRLAEDYLELERLSGMPLVRSYPPPYNISGRPAELAAEEVATSERNRLGIGDGPISDLRERLENDVGLRVFYYPMPSKIAGVFSYTQSLGGCVGINANHPRDRRHYSLAHEYGHFLTSRYQPEITFLAESKRHSGRERFADSFANAFLMPANGLNRRFSDIDRSKEQGVTLADIVSLANLYQVSVQALILRLEGLRRLPAGTWENLASEGFKVRHAQHLLGIEANPPMKDLLPQRYQDLAALAHAKEQISEGQVAKFLRMDRVSARALIEELNLRIHAEVGDEFRQLDLDLASPLTGR
jgi:Zn-dependent peptidase ImmA (M78 family)/DNA-binding XRE family transcriptional regulator